MQAATACMPACITAFTYNYILPKLCGSDCPVSLFQTYRRVLSTSHLCTLTMPHEACVVLSQFKLLKKQRKQAQILVYISELLLCYMNSGCVLECRDTPTSHSVTWYQIDPYICPFPPHICRLSTFPRICV